MDQDQINFLSGIATGLGMSEGPRDLADVLRKIGDRIEALGNKDRGARVRDLADEVAADSEEAECQERR